MKQLFRSTVSLVLPVLLAASVEAQGSCPPITPSPDWKSSIAYPSDPFRADSGAFGEPGWVKFTTLTCDTNTIYFQDSQKYDFHFEFATQVLDPFLGLSLPQFEAVTLFEQGREALLGAVVLPPVSGFPPASSFPELGIQLISQDPLDPQLVVDVFTSVRASIGAGPEVQAYYFPTFEQQESAQQNASFFLQNGIVLSSTARWLTGNACYSRGWALGRLLFVPADQIDSAFTSGLLKATDILLTDGIPASVPLVAGIATLVPSYPSSHVAILASTFQVPFVFLGDPEDAAQAQKLVGRRVVMRAFDDLFAFAGDGCDVSFVDVEHLSAAKVSAILELKVPEPLQFPPTMPFGGLYSPTDGLIQSDARFFGGKAANFGFLRRSIPNDSPVSLGLSFDLWNEYLQQPMPSGNTLGQDIDLVLAQHSYPPIDPQAFADDMSALRDMVEDDADFTPLQMADIVAACQDPQFAFTTAKLRFRSSTNVEDAEQFTGAGLYDSNSGCLLDDLDGDASGPSACDPLEPKEKGVFRAIRKVFASFYNDNAVLERLRHGIDESQVGMAVLVHHSFPDELEDANGVATLDRTGFGTTITLITQLGAVSVTNPEGNAIPEEVRVTVSGQSFFPSLVTSSSLVQLGDTVMTYPSDYTQLAGLLVAVADRFELDTRKTGYVLDFEYKLMAAGGAVKPAGGLVVKQVRELPQLDTTPNITPFLVNAPRQYELQQGHNGSVFANHRLKSTWYLETKDAQLDPNVLGPRSLLAHTIVRYNHGCGVATDGGPFGGLPGAAHFYDPLTLTAYDSFRPKVEAHPRTLELRTAGVGQLVSEAASPILTLVDLASAFGGLTLDAFYDAPVPILDAGGQPATVLSESARLVPSWKPSAADTFREHVFTESGVTITTSYWLQPIVGFCAGCIQPLSRWVATTIEGLTSVPIVLTDDFAMSYEAGQHNFTEHFLFEPRLDPAVTQAQLDELDAQNVGQIHVRTFFGSSTVTLLAGDGCVAPPEPTFPLNPRWAVKPGPQLGK